MRNELRHFLIGGAAAFLLASGLALAAEKLSPTEAAKQIDATLAKEAAASQSAAAQTSAGGSRAAKIDDEGYLRRATLDLIGRPPTTEEIAFFVLDPSPDKRAKLVGRLLADEEYGKNWGRYWRDVIMYRASEPRAQLASAALEKYMTESLNKDVRWRQIASSFITATGDVREKGETALIMAQQGQAEETTAEVARIFMGIQIQCAQCHDHPTDRWKRTQFHELAAFFPRIAVRPVRVDGQQRSFEVASVNREFRGRPGGQPGRGSLEHYMSDLKDPAAKGTLMTPKFFVTNSTYKQGASDEDRRQTLANLLTASSNPWFSRALVNRLWAEMAGEGFYDPVDDLGPDRPCSAPKTLQLLADQFAANGHSLKWAYETIAATEAYQRQSRQRRTTEEPAFAANCHQRLRGDQLFAALAQVLEFSEQALGGGPRPKAPGGLYGGGGARFAFNQTFGFDPSTPKDELAGSIPQALFLMNSPLVNGAIDGRRNASVIQRIVSEIKDDQAAVTELYLRCLSREPKPNEIKTCLDHLATVKDRREALEDLLWALVNGSEFQHRK